MEGGMVEMERRGGWLVGGRLVRVEYRARCRRDGGARTGRITTREGGGGHHTPCCRGGSQPAGPHSQMLMLKAHLDAWSNSQVHTLELLPCAHLSLFPPPASCELRCGCHESFLATCVIYRPIAGREDNPVVRRGMVAWAGGASGTCFACPARLSVSIRPDTLARTPSVLQPLPAISIW